MNGFIPHTGRVTLSDALAVSRGAVEPKFRGLRNRIRGLWVPPLGLTGNKLPDLSGYNNMGTIISCPWSIETFGPVVLGTNNGTQRIELDRRITVSSRNFTFWAMVYTTGANSLYMTQSDISRYAMYQTSTGMQCRADGIEGAAFVQTLNQWSQIAITVSSVGSVLYYTQGSVGAVDPGLAGDFNFDFIMNTASQDFAVDGAIGAIAIFERDLSQVEIRHLLSDWTSIVAPKYTMSPAFPVPGGGGGVGIIPQAMHYYQHSQGAA